MTKTVINCCFWFGRRAVKTAKGQGISMTETWKQRRERSRGIRTILPMSGMYSEILGKGALKVHKKKARCVSHDQREGEMEKTSVGTKIMTR